MRFGEEGAARGSRKNPSPWEDCGVWPIRFGRTAGPNKGARQEVEATGRRKRLEQSPREVYEFETRHYSWAERTLRRSICVGFRALTFGTTKPAERRPVVEP